MVYDRPGIATDGIVVEDGKILLIERKHGPFEGSYAIPGGFVDYGEAVEDAVVREMKEETNLDVRIMRLVGVYSRPDRDPRGHVISVVYQVERIGGDLEAGDDAADAVWFDLDDLPLLAFDHAQIIADFLEV